MRPLLFRLPPETAHHATIEACRVGARVPGVRSLGRRWLGFDDRLHTTVAGLTFPNPIGLAAGWDKSGRASRALDALGFGFAEIGSVSARASKGNPKPRLFRVPDEEALIVNYGLPNEGVDAVAKRLACLRSQIPIGVNIVKTNDGPGIPVGSDDEIFEDYVDSVSRVHTRAGYLMLNLSCPNADGGKDFFAIQGNIQRLLEALRSISMASPVFLKLPPTQEPRVHDRWLSECDPFAFVRGFMFNLCPGKPDWLKWEHTSSHSIRSPGAVAGPPIADWFLGCIASLSRRMDRDRYALFGGGGIRTADDAWNQIIHGASLVQIYSALIYQGPAVTRRLCRGLAEKMTRHGFQSLQEAVGSGL